MKRIIHYFTLWLLLVGIAFSSCSYADNAKEKPIFDRLILSENVTTFKIPAFIVRYVLRFTDEGDELRNALSGTTSFRFAITENARDTEGIFDRINSKLNVSRYTNLMEINDGKSKITIKYLESKEKIREIVFLVSDSESFVCFSIKGRISPENLSAIATGYMESKGKENKDKG